MQLLMKSEKDFTGWFPTILKLQYSYEHVLDFLKNTELWPLGLEIKSKDYWKYIQYKTKQANTQTNKHVCYTITVPVSLNDSNCF
jgi:hypothetical protein